MATLLIITLALFIALMIALANIFNQKAKEAQMAGELDTLAQQVATNTSAEQSAIDLLNNLHKLLSDALATQDIAKVEAITAQLKTSADNLAAAVVANTPAAAPAPESAPEPSN